MMKYVIVAAGVLAFSATAHAEFGVGAKAGTLGAGVELTKSISPRFNGRIGFNTYTFNTTGTESDIDYDVDLKMQNTAAILDFHPFKGTFRLSVGYVYNNNEIDMEGKPGGSMPNSYTINGVDYTLNSLDGNVSFTNGAFVGMGWGNAGRKKGFGMSLELGAIYQGSPDLELTASGSPAVVNDPVFQQNLVQEEADAEKSVEHYQWYPAASLGISYTF